MIAPCDQRAEIFCRHLARLADSLILRLEVEGSPDPTEAWRQTLRLDGIVGRSAALAALLRQVAQVSPLDVSVLQDHLLAPALGIEDPRTDTRLDFVGGARGTRELQRRVDEASAAVAFSMYPVSVAELMTVSDQGAIMPPKSTWFEPKLRDGLLIHLI